MCAAVRPTLWGRPNLSFPNLSLDLAFSDYAILPVNKVQELTDISPSNSSLHSNSMTVESEAYLFDKKYTTTSDAPGVIAMEPAESVRM